jgi:hypothetical protein
MTSAPFSIADLNAIAGQTSFQSVIDVARRFGLSAFFREAVQRWDDTPR